MKVADSLANGFYVQADVSDAEQSAALVDQTIERYGRLDILVNNAGYTKVISHPDLDAVSDDLFRKILDVNLIGPFRLSKLALPHLRRSGQRKHCEREFRRGDPADGQLHPVRLLEGGVQPFDATSRERSGTRGTSERCRARIGEDPVDRRLGSDPRRYGESGCTGQVRPARGDRFGNR